MSSNANTIPSESPANPVAASGWRWAPAFVLAFVALFPAPGYAEGILVLGSLFAIARLLMTKFRGGAELLSGPAWALTSVLFFAYWLPQFFSSFDAINSAGAITKVLKGLRYLPFLWLAASAVATPRNRDVTFKGLAIIVGIWVLDALAQVLFGTSPVFWGIDALKLVIDGHRMCTPEETAALDRLSGFLGPCNLKLGQVVASFSPFLLFFVSQRGTKIAWIIAAALIGVVILLAGSRGSWITYGIVLLLSGWRVLGAKGLLGIMLFGALSLVAMYFTVPQVTQRVDRTLTALTGDNDGVDNALSGRGRIWSAAGCMIAEHPINGVGIRGFRDAFTQCDPEPGSLEEWGEGPAFHAHQIVLEILSETGILGLILWLMGAAMAIRAWRYAPAYAKQRSLPAMWALVATVFPLNTSLAFYSTFWGSVTLLLSALFVGALLARDQESA